MKRVLRLFLFSLFLLVIFLVNGKVEANSIQKVSIDIYIDDNGTATITENWECTTSKGTEINHPYYYLGNSKIQNLTVSEGDKKYQTLSEWNIYDNISSKAYKCGINYISNGVELCWGISSYGLHNYTVKYNITNFVSELSDSQIIHWKLIPYDFPNAVEKVYIKIHTDFCISKSIDVWGYGSTGIAHVYDGNIEINSDGKHTGSDYIEILVKFPKGTFNTQNILNKKFKNIYQKSEEYATNKFSSNKINIFAIIAIIAYIFQTIIALSPVLILLGILTITMLKQPTYNFGPNGISIPKRVEYFRDIPCQNNLFRSYYIGYKYGIINNKTNILGAIILKWFKHGIIRIEKKETGKILKKENTIIVLNNSKKVHITNTCESEIFSMLYEASKDGILESKEFERWCNNKYFKILSWFYKIIDEEQDKLINEGKIIVEEKKILNFIKRKVYKFTPELKQNAIELAGLKRYLLDYSLIEERAAIEVHLFEDYLIYAKMLGIAKKVAKQFRELYPENINHHLFRFYV